MVVQTSISILTIGVILPFVNVLTSSISCKYSNTNPTTFMITINAQIYRTFTNMSSNTDVYNHGLFCASSLVFFVSLKGSIKGTQFRISS